MKRPYGRWKQWQRIWIAATLIWYGLVSLFATKDQFLLLLVLPSAALYVVLLLAARSFPALDSVPDQEGTTSIIALDQDSESPREGNVEFWNWFLILFCVALFLFAIGPIFWRSAYPR